MLQEKRRDAGEIGRDKPTFVGRRVEIVAVINTVVVKSADIKIGHGTHSLRIADAAALEHEHIVRHVTDGRDLCGRNRQQRQRAPCTQVCLIVDLAPGQGK